MPDLDPAQTDVPAPSVPKSLPAASDESDDDDLQDRELSQEIELVGDLVVAASDSEADLSPGEIDRILGLDEEPES